MGILTARRGTVAGRAVGGWRQAAIELGPEALYLADDLSDGWIPDSSGNGRAGMQVVGAAPDTSDKPAAFTRSLQFDGVDDYAHVPAQPWANRSGPLTVVAVAKRTGTASVYQRLFGRGDDWYGIEHDGGSGGRLYGYTATGAIPAGDGKTGFVTDVPAGWTTWAVRNSSANQAFLHLGGLQKASRPAQIVPSGNFDETVQVGHRHRISTGTRDFWWPGRWCALAVYHRELTASELGSLEDALDVAGGAPPPPPPPDPTLTGSLTDTFGTLDPAKWGASWGGPTVTGGRLRLPMGVSYSGVYSADGLRLAGSHIAIQHFPPSPMHESGELTVGYVNDVWSDTHRVLMAHTYWGLLCRIWTAGTLVYDQQSSSAAALYAWRRIVEQAGTLSFQTSTDGTSWGTIFSTATPSWVANLNTGRILLMAGNWQTNSGEHGEFDNLNI